MLLTLSASSLRSMIGRQGRSSKAKAGVDLLDLPTFARETLGLHGLTLSTDLLAGVSRDYLEELRERADKAACACLLLVDPDALPLAHADEAKAAAGVDRAGRVLQAAQLLGCNAAAISVEGPDDDVTFSRAVDRLRKAMGKAENLQLNLLLAPARGLTQSPDRVAELLKKTGGFRLGTYPDFAAAAASDDPTSYLRRLTPYASVVCASTTTFTNPKGGAAGKDIDAHAAHAEYDLAPLVDAIQSVGYEGTLSIDYRGTGDATLGVLRSKMLLEAILDPDAASAAELLDPEDL
jgi:sugar phosphate isomerase/epimerase